MPLMANLNVSVSQNFLARCSGQYSMAEKTPEFGLTARNIGRFPFTKNFGKFPLGISVWEFPFGKSAFHLPQAPFEGAEGHLAV